MAGPIAGVSILAPKPVAPASASQIAVDQQPVTLTVENASSNGVRPLNYIFEVAMDNGFTNKILSQAGVAPGTGGRTSLRLTQSLAAERTYYWRTKADDGANASDYSAPLSFHVYTPVIIQPPALQSPVDGAALTTRKPTLTVINAKRTGPAGAMQYPFEAATDSAFANKVISVLVNEGSTQTSYAPPGDLAYATGYYWRVKATDPGHESGYSSVWSFMTPAAPVVVTPTPGPGPTPIPNGSFDPRAATFLNNPSDVGSWPQTAKITAVDFNGGTFTFDFDRRVGAGRWPESGFGSDAGIQYTLGMCFKLSNQWSCSAAIQYWDGREPVAPTSIADNWYYDAIRWGPMAGHQPANGEQIAIWVGQGNLRGSGNSNRERSDFAVMSFGGTYRGQ